MSRTRLLVWTSTVLGGLVGCLGVWNALDADDEAQPSPKYSLVTSETLGGPNRFLAHLSTDKPLYRPGEELRVRGVVLHANAHRPAPYQASAGAVVSIQGPKGDVVASGMAAGEDSVVAFAWQIPDDQPGGTYKILVQLLSGQAPAERSFEVRAYRAPRLKSQLKFVRDGYGPSDQVAASLEVERAEGGIPEDATVTVSARVDGEEIHRATTKIDASGRCFARFLLPDKIERGEGVLVMSIEDGGVIETASKTIPILLQTVDLAVYPEGGELVAGLRTRVYFEAFTPAGKPADLAGIVVDRSGQPVAEFRSEHEGRGRFELKPRGGQQYRMRITEPAGIATEFPLPAVKKSGATLSSRRDVYPPGRPVTLRVATTHPQVSVTLSRREQPVASTTVDKSGRVRFDVPEQIDGVLVATVWDSVTGKPLAERLIFRQPRHSIRILLSPEADHYSPGDRARVSILTTNQRGEPLSAVVGIQVTDDSVLEMIDKREQAPDLPTMVLLESDVRDLADSHVYLDSSHAHSAQSLDLLLGTQGWRRFAFVEPVAFTKQHNDAARRVLASVETIGLSAGFGGGMKIFSRWRNEVDELSKADNQLVFDELPGADKKERADAEQAEHAAAGEELNQRGSAADDADDGGRDVPAPERSASAADPKDREAAGRLFGEADIAGRRQLPNGFSGGLAVGGKALRNDFRAYRVYSHQVRPERREDDRVDFTETLYWHAGVKTDENGRGMIEFGLNDSVTSFRISANAFSASGALGSHSIQVDSVKPFYLEPKLPLEVTQGDKILSPLGIVNATGDDFPEASIEVTAHGYRAGGALRSFRLEGGQRRRELLEFSVRETGAHQVVIEGRAGSRSDRVTRNLIVQPRGFPVELGRGGLIVAGGTAQHSFVIPPDVVDGSLNGRVVVYPTPLANMTESLKRLIREPNGCFEQTSSTTYPLVMAQQYFMSHEGVDPALIQQSAGVLEKGYNRLLGFESPGGGFEWFGRDPGHDALTAYGILEFTDMSQVRHVDADMLERTREWLLAQRDGRGGFVRKAATHHCWVADPEIANTYNLWALMEAGETADLSKEIAWVREAAESSQNTYVKALAANVLGLAGDTVGQDHLLDALAGLQQQNGSLSGATQSVVGSGGVALQIETAALATMAWLKNANYADNVEQSIQYLAEGCKSGRFGSTQSTVLALRAIVAYDQSRATPQAPGSLTLLVDGKPVGEPVAFSATEHGAIHLPQLPDRLEPGSHELALVMDGGARMPYSMSLEFHREQPESQEQCPMHLEVSLNEPAVTEGEATEANVTVINRSDGPVPSPVAIIGVPGGLEVRHDQLKELVEADRIAAYEVIGREIVLYWRVLDAEQRVDLPLSLVAEIPGTYTAPASRAYLYYTDELKRWAAPLRVQIHAAR